MWQANCCTLENQKTALPRPLRARTSLYTPRLLMLLLHSPHRTSSSRRMWPLSVCWSIRFRWLPPYPVKRTSLHPVPRTKASLAVVLFVLPCNGSCCCHTPPSCIHYSTRMLGIQHRKRCRHQGRFDHTSTAGPNCNTGCSCPPVAQVNPSATQPGLPALRSVQRWE